MADSFERARDRGTPRLSAKDALGASEARFLETVELAPVGIAHVAPSGRFLRVNRRLAAMLGYTSNALLAMRVHDLAHPQDLSRDLEHALLAASEQTEYTIEKRYVGTAGAAFWAVLTVHVVRERNGAGAYFVVIVEDVSAKKEALAAVERREAAFQSLVDNDPDIVARYGPDLRHLYVSPGVARATGRPAAEFIGRTNAELGYPEPLLSDWESFLRRIFATGKAGDTVLAVPTLDGERRYWARCVPELDANGEVASAVCMTRDVTERDRLFESLQAARDIETWLRAATDVAEVGVWEAHPTAGTFRATTAAMRLHGLTGDVPNDLRGAFHNVHPDDRERAQAALEQAALDGTSFHEEVRIVLADGSVRWVVEYGRGLGEEAGEAKGRLVGLARDVTDEHAARERIAEGEARFRATFEQAPIGIAHIGLDGRWLRFNAQLPRMLGWSAEDLQKRSFQELTHADDLALDLEQSDRLVRGEIESYTLEKRYRRADGTSAWAHLTHGLVRDGDGSPSYFVAVIEDIHERKEIEAERERLVSAERRARERTEALQALTAELSGARTAVDVAAVTLDAGCRAIGFRFGSVYLADAGAEPGTMLTYLHTVGYDPATVARYSQIPIDSETLAGAAAFRGEPVIVGRRAEVVERYPALAPLVASTTYCGGAVFPIFTHTTSGRSGNARVMGIIAFDFDADRELKDDELSFLQTLSQLCAQALGRARAFDAERAARSAAEGANVAKSNFLATMSHELRTPLNAIGGYTQLIEMGVHGPVSPEQIGALGSIARSQRHLLSLIDEVLDFAQIESGRSAYRLSAVSVMQTLEELVTVMAPLVSAKGLALHVTPPARDMIVCADVDRMRQVLVNLVANAIKFTPAGGRVTVTAHAGVRSVGIDVSDTGAGVAIGDRETIFEPFVQLGRSLSTPRDGTGLGLAISREHARAMRGDVTVGGEPGAGAVFTLTLPLDLTHAQ